MNYAGAHAFDVKFDPKALEEVLYTQAIAAANAAGEFALTRARKHAPVRKIFKAGSTRRSELFDRYASPAGIARQARDRRVRTPGGGAEDLRGVRLGHPNSNEPVFRVGNRAITGDFRRVGRDESGVRALLKVPFNESTVHRGGRLVDVSQAGRKASASSQLTGRGTFEVQSGRANFRSPRDNQVRVGGRLRGELYLSRAERVGDQVWAHVVSPTKDPKTGFPYNRAMEFGTVHNRPYPFLRPGLAETRPVLKREARRHLKSAARR